VHVAVHGAAIIPVLREPMCPSGPDCVLGLGAGVGAQLEWRTAERIGLFLGYDFWVLDAAGVFEVGALHAVRGGVRYVIDDSMRVHPFVDAAVGFLAFGDTATVATAGGGITLGAGAEVEISEAVAFVGAAEAWLFATAPFATRDGALRAADFGVDVVVQVTVGIAVTVGPTVVPP
jgi:hypothetical protein